MADPLKSTEDRLSERLDRQAARKLRARHEGRKSAWFGLGTFGLVGWSVAIPTLLGTLVGLWIDHRAETTDRSWTLALLLGGLTIGCLTAWFWVDRESRDAD